MASLIWACGGTLEDRGHEAASAAFVARALRQKEATVSEALRIVYSMDMSTPFLARLSETVARYRAEVASPREHLSLLRWQIAQGHALDDRAT